MIHSIGLYEFIKANPEIATFLDAGGFKVLEEEMFLEGIIRLKIIKPTSSWSAFGKQLENRMFNKKKNKREWEHNDFTEDGEALSSIEIVSDKTKKKISLLEKRVSALEADTRNSDRILTEAMAAMEASTRKLTEHMEARLRHLEITSPVTTACKFFPSLPDLEGGQEW